MKAKNLITILSLATLTACSTVPKKEALDVRFLNKDFANFYVPEKIVEVDSVNIKNESGRTICSSGKTYLVPTQSQIRLDCPQLKVNETVTVEVKTQNYRTFVDKIPVSY